MPAQIVIADPDYGYIKQYEEELLKKYAQRADIRIITQPDYLANYFRVHRVIDVLIIAREFYGPFVKDHDIGYLLVLDQEVSLEFGEDGKEYSTLMKYTSSDEMFAFIDKALEDSPLEQPEAVMPHSKGKEVKIISVYSPMGGCGKSLVSVALGRKIKKLEESAIVVGCDDLQSVGIYLENRQPADESLASALKTPNEDTYWEILRNVAQEEVPCILPFEKPLSVLGVGTDELLNLVGLLKSKGDFKYIILDLGTDMGETNRALVSISDLCILITEPNLCACRKLEKLMMNQDLFPVKSSITISNQAMSDGIHLNPENLFGSFASYDNIEEAMEDPLFYRLALEITE